MKFLRVFAQIIMLAFLAPVAVRAHTIDEQSFLSLGDTPDSYLGEGEKCVGVDVTETALEFVDCGSGGGGSGDITSVWGDDTGDVSALTAGAGDTLNAGGADSTIPWEVDTTAAPTTEGRAIWNSDDDTLAVGDGAATLYALMLSSAIDPSANVEAILGAADYAAIRTLLDLEAGTDFYSIAGADAAFQAIDSDLDSLAAGITGLAKGAGNGGGYSAATIDSSGTCGTGDVCGPGHTHPTTELSGVNAGTDLTADLEEETHGTEHDGTDGDYVKDSGDTMEGELVVDNLGLEFTPGDDHSDCSAFAATGGGIFYDDSEGVFKKCQDNVLSDLDTTAAGGGDAVTVNGTGADTTANLVDGGIKWTLTDGGAGGPDDITGTINFGTAFPGSPATGDVFVVTDDSAAGECDSSAGSALSLCRYNGSAWEAVGDGGGGGADTNAVKEYWWPAAATLPLEAADSIPPIAKDAGTNIDQLTIDENDSVDECRGVTFKVPSDVDTGGTVTFRKHWYSAAATTGSACHDFRHNGGVAEGTDPDQALTTEAAACDATQGTAGQLTFTTWTETITNLGWSANEQVDGEFCRDANNGSDDLVGDSKTTGYGLEIPRA